jgi:hypothetical protein
MKYYLKISCVNEEEVNGTNVTPFGPAKSCPKSREILIPMTAEEPREAGREYRELFEILKMFEKEEGSSFLHHAITKSILGDSK